MLLCGLIVILTFSPHLLAASNMNAGYVDWLRTMEFGQVQPAFFNAFPPQRVSVMWHSAFLLAPESKAVQRGRGWMLLAEGAEEGALAAWEAGGVTAGWLAGQGQRAHRAGYFQEALNWYNLAIDLDPEQQEGWYGRGMTNLELGKWDEALADFRRATTSRGRIPLGTVYFQIGLLLFDKVSPPDLDGALEAFNNVLADGNFADGTHHLWTYYVRAEVLRQKGQMSDAPQDAETAFGLYPTDYDTVYHLSVLYWEVGRVEPAEELLLRAVEMNPNRRQAFWMLGFLYKETGRTEAAIEMFQHALDLDPTDEGVQQLINELTTDG